MHGGKRLKEVARSSTTWRGEIASPEGKEEVGRGRVIEQESDERRIE